MYMSIVTIALSWESRVIRLTQGDVPRRAASKLMRSVLPLGDENITERALNFPPRYPFT